MSNLTSLDTYKQNVISEEMATILQQLSNTEMDEYFRHQYHVDTISKINGFAGSNVIDAFNSLNATHSHSAMGAYGMMLDRTLMLDADVDAEIIAQKGDMVFNETGVRLEKKTSIRGYRSLSRAQFLFNIMPSQFKADAPRQVSLTGINLIDAKTVEMGFVDTTTGVIAALARKSKQAHDSHFVFALNETLTQGDLTGKGNVPVALKPHYNATVKDHQIKLASFGTL